MCLVKRHKRNRRKDHAMNKYVEFAAYLIMGGLMAVGVFLSSGCSEQIDASESCRPGERSACVGSVRTGGSEEIERGAAVCRLTMVGSGGEEDLVEGRGPLSVVASACVQ